MRQGSLVEIRYIGKGLGIVDKGVVKAVHSDGTMDIELENFPYGIKFSVNPKIVHEVKASEYFQSKLNELMQ